MAGHKLWAVGEEMLQADFQPIVADQIVAVFANSTARDAGWPSPPNGAMAVTTDSNTLWQRQGGAWKATRPAVTPTLGSLNSTYGAAVNATDKLTMHAGTAVVTTNGSGDIVIAYPTAFTSTTVTVLCGGGDGLSDVGTIWVPHSVTNANFQARAILCTTGLVRASYGPIRMNYLAIGV